MNWHTLTILHAVPTLFLTGLIWFVQVVHYPLFARVGEREFVAWEREHCRRITWVVMPLMLTEVALATWLWWQAPPEWRTWAAAGLVLLGIVWASTFLVQVPCHERLARGLDRPTVRRLVRTNWLRTAAWTGRGVVAVVLAVG